MLHLIFALVVALVWYPAGAATIVHDKDRLVLTGPIRWGDNVAFFAAVNSGRNIKTVVLNSDGGTVDEAIDIGRTIREHHLDTTVPASSICVPASWFGLRDTNAPWTANWQRIARPLRAHSNAVRRPDSW